MLNLYSVFHCNLAFSMIPRRHFPALIERCYWPLLRLAEKGVPLGIEMTAWTLNEVANIDPVFVSKLKELWDSGSCEFIGSGNSQAIFPLIPAEVNRWNLAAGNRHYERLLGRRPGVALVNEQTYSRGLVDLYREAGYETIIMDWNNCCQHNHYPKEFKYGVQRAAGIKGDINLLWSHSIAFQKFQRCVHGEIGVEEYVDYLMSHHEPSRERAFVVYSNDAEVFDFRPGQVVTAMGEYEKIAEIYSRIASDKRVSLKTPGAVVERFKGVPDSMNIVRLESSETPVVCKKQEKYNPVRWAVAGRDSVHINTECFRIFENIKSLEGYGVPQEALVGYKEMLTLLWGSDFRTNTEDEKFRWLQDRLGWVKLETERLLEAEKAKKTIGMAVLGANIYKGSHVGAIASQLSGSDKKKPVKASTSSSENILRVATGTVVAEFLENKGLAIKSLSFPGVSDKTLVGTLPHGHYEDMRLGADFFSGHLIHVTRDGKKTTDLKHAHPVIDEDDAMVNVKTETTLDIGTLWKTYVISKTEHEVSVTYTLKVNGLSASSLRLGIFTFIPSGFDVNGLWFETVNGGAAPERFYLKGHEIAHDEPVSQCVSASGCLGATEGWVRVGDGKKSVTISADRSKLYSVPMLNFKEPSSEETFFLRLYHSLGEVDDTAWWVWRGYNEITFKITAAKS
ncbi:MAG: hypothetical protein HY889_04800 [Deltaproteobacteria bacterium]|nr:hypothetical protein [Deltaproteobacteria bacterium]